MYSRTRSLLLAALFTISSAWLVSAGHADEGMWTFQNFPSQLVKQKYGADITPAWLDHVRQSTVRLQNCTASFVSANGLILTNHHCAAACLDENSTAERNLLKDGYLAKRREDEVRCRTQIADILVGVEDVTAKIKSATQGLDDRAANDTRKKTLTELEQTCEQTTHLKCESVNLYEGGQQMIYRYQRYSDVRLVFAPEDAIAAFGGDPDNFQFPRWCLDMSVLRAYDSQGKPVVTPNFLKMNFNGPQPKDLVFVSGHPGSTDRLLTVAELETARNVDLPRSLLRASELRGRYIQYGKSSDEAARIVLDPLNSLQNSLKVRRKLLDALLDDKLMRQKRTDEAALRHRVLADSPLAQEIGDPWKDLERAQQTEETLSLPYSFLEGGVGFNSKLFGYARTLLRGTTERDKPNTDRLREYSDAALPRVEQRLGAKLPIYPELEQLTLSFSLERMREWLGPDHPMVRLLMAKDSPDSLAARLVKESKLADPVARMQLWKDGAAAVSASTDPMIVLAKAIDAPSRAIRKRYEDEVEAPARAASEKIARARFAELGASVAPDANFTLRLNFGTVQGWKENGQDVPPYTYLSRLFERATGNEPFRVPDSWLKVKEKLDLNTRFNLVTDNDIVGGNSGSPLINTKGEIVGLMFDGNIHSISGAYWFDAEKNRAVAVHPAIIREALSKVYGADKLLGELSGK